jgi:hypothetical protein
MGHSQFPGVLVSEATASAQRQSGAVPAHCPPARRRKVLDLLDSLNIGGTGMYQMFGLPMFPERFGQRSQHRGAE